MPHGKENEWTAPRPERKKQSVSIHRHTIQYTDCPKELPEAARTYVNAARSQDLGKEHLCVCGCTRVVAHAWLHVCGCTCMVAHVWSHVRGGWKGSCRSRGSRQDAGDKDGREIGLNFIYFSHIRSLMGTK